MKIASYGEVNLRFTPPQYQLLAQTDQLTYQVTGTGVNLLTNLKSFGMQVSLLTTLPRNNVGVMAAANLRKYGIDDKYVNLNGSHMGSYFVELGYGCRPTVVTYQNRLASAFCQAAVESYPIEEILTEHDGVHICGISLSLTDQTRRTALKIADTAKRLGKKVYFDFNYRPSLNTSHGKEFIREQYERILPNVDTAFGNIRDLNELLDIAVDPSKEELEQLREASEVFKQKYGVSTFAGTLRAGDSQEHLLSGFLAREDFKVSRKRPLHMLDRIGAGDAYAAGVIYGVEQSWKEEKVLEFAVSNAILAHTIEGDVPYTDLAAVDAVMKEKQQSLIR